jgi:Ni,Fe-hydrogenase III component G
MRRTEIRPDELQEKVRAFYDPARWRFLTVNATDTGSGLLIDWIFVAIGRVAEPVIFSSSVDYEALLPSLAGTIPASALGEAEMLDLLGVRFEGAQPGLFLEPDAPRAPLLKPRKEPSGD